MNFAQIALKLTSMETQLAKALPVITLLSNLGHRPTKENDREAWFISPIRSTEATPSFKVDKAKNCWYDHGAGLGGNTLDLAHRLLKQPTLADTLQTLEQFLTAVPATKAQKAAPPVIQLQSVKPLRHPVLLDYAASRAIDPDIAAYFLMEAHYTIHNRRYFALAFQNLKLGYELRNAHFKGCTAPKAPTLLLKNANGYSNEVLVFEGFFDLLSFLVLKKTIQLPGDVMVLNSLALLPGLMPTLKARYAEFHLFLDNDQAGKNAARFFPETQSIFYNQEIYPGYKDLNEFLIARKSAGKLPTQ